MVKNENKKSATRTNAGFDAIGMALRMHKKLFKPF